MKILTGVGAVAGMVVFTVALLVPILVTQNRYNQATGKQSPPFYPTILRITAFCYKIIFSDHDGDNDQHNRHHIHHLDRDNL